MKSPGKFFKAIIPIISIVLALTGSVQLRSGIWTAGAICIVLAVAVFVISVRRTEKNPFTAEELETVKPILVPRIVWFIIISLVTFSVIDVAGSVNRAETDRIAAAAWVCAPALSLMIPWWNGIRRSLTDTLPSLRENIRTNRTELISLFLALGMAFLLRTIDWIRHPYAWSGDEVSMAKLFASETVTYVTHQAIQIHGGMGY